MDVGKTRSRLPKPTFDLVLVITSSITLGGCIYSAPIRNDFYKPKAGAVLTGPRVALIADAGETTTVYGPTGVGDATIETKPALMLAIKSGLTGLFGPTAMIGEGEKDSNVDYIVRLNPQFPRIIGLSFMDSESSRIIASYDRPGPTITERKDSRFYEYISYFPGLYFLMTITGNVEGGRARKIVENTLADALDDIFSQIRGDAALTDYLVNKARVKKLEGDGDASLQSGNLAAAMDSYKEALILVATGTNSETRIREKYFQAILRKGDRLFQSGDAAGALVSYTLALDSMPRDSDLAVKAQDKQIEAVIHLAPRPAIPDKAKDLMTLGKAFVAQAKNQQDYAQAIENMNKALKLAPWWSSGHFNTAVADEGAGRWAEAQFHLRYYLKLDPDAQDKEKVRQKIAELEVHVEKADAPPGQK